MPPNQGPSGAGEGDAHSNDGRALAGVGKTALGVAVVRARESQRPDRLFNDPLAQAVDLREDWPASLTAAGFDRSVQTAWLAEGLLIYLTANESERLFTEVSVLSAPHSQLAVEHGGMAGNSLLEQAGKLPAMQEYAALWKGGMGEDLPSRLVGHGWQVRAHDLAAVSAAYHRDVPGHSRGGFLTALRR